MPFESHEAYFATVPADVRARLQSVRQEVQRRVPGAQACIGYNMPAFRQQRIFFYFAAFKHHIGVYPPITHDQGLIEETARYRGPKGNLSFPLKEALPLALIGKVAAALAGQYAPKQAATPAVTLRPMTEADIPMLHQWLQRPHVVEWWGGEDERPTLEQTRAWYLPRVLAEEQVTPYIALLGRRPIAYAQSYVAMGCGDGWWANETDPGVRGIDQFLADPRDLGRGLGTRVVQALVQQLFSDPAVTKVQTDPAPANRRAIRCYEKAGFERVGLVDTPDGPAVYMVRLRARGL